RSKRDWSSDVCSSDLTSGGSETSVDRLIRADRGRWYPPGRSGQHQLLADPDQRRVRQVVGPGDRHVATVHVVALRQRVQGVAGLDRKSVVEGRSGELG